MDEWSSQTMHMTVIVQRTELIDWYNGAVTTEREYANHFRMATSASAYRGETIWSSKSCGRLCLL